MKRKKSVLNKTPLKKAAQKQREGEAKALLSLARKLAKDLREGRVFAFDITYRKKRRSIPKPQPGRTINLKYVFDSPGAL